MGQLSRTRNTGSRIIHIWSVIWGWCNHLYRCWLTNDANQAFVIPFRRFSILCSWANGIYWEVTKVLEAVWLSTFVQPCLSCHSSFFFLFASGTYAIMLQKKGNIGHVKYVEKVDIFIWVMCAMCTPKKRMYMNEETSRFQNFIFVCSLPLNHSKFSVLWVLDMKMTYPTSKVFQIPE